VHQENSGTGAAINAGCNIACAPFFLGLGADDELLPEYVAATSQFIDNNPDNDVYAANAYVVSPEGIQTPYFEDNGHQRVGSITLDNLIDAPQIYGTAAFRRSFFEKVGGFRPEIYNEDYDFWLRIMAAGARHIYQPLFLSRYHLSSTQKTADVITARASDIQILRDLIASGHLNPEETQHAEHKIASIEKNINTRKRLYKLIGRDASEKLIGFFRDRKTP
jgi:GT2 family glycosyltransferase